ncbi:hypothetical protein HYV82_00630 [Candidatus Woesearchaeota archaeon]|nr:hypothetical protein [Candidatus Woesearchaeota archaeon]
MDYSPLKKFLHGETFKIVTSLAIAAPIAIIAVTCAEADKDNRLARHVFEVNYDTSNPEAEHYVVMDRKLYAFTEDNKLVPFPDSRLESAIWDKFFGRSIPIANSGYMGPERSREEVDLLRSIKVIRLEDYLRSK